jgi:outer membrane protein TolC
MLLAPVGAPGAARADDDLAPLSLRLTDAVTRALEHNLDVAIARTRPQESELNVILGKAAFDTVLSASMAHSEDTSEPSSTFSTTQSESDEAAVSAAGLITSGLTWDASLFHRDDSSVLASAAFQQIPDSFTSGVRVNLRQPLLHGFGREFNRTEIVLAQRNLNISERQFEQSLLDTVQAVEDAYWNLLSARKSLEVARKSLGRAQDLYELNKTKVEVGTLAPIEITTAEAEVAQRDQDVIRGRRGRAQGPDEHPARLARLVPPDHHRR